MAEPLRAMDCGARACASVECAHPSPVDEALRRIEALQRENEALRSACAQQLARMSGKDDAIEKLNAELVKVQNETRTLPGGGGGGDGGGGGRGKAKARALKECDPQEFQFGGVPFFDHFEIGDAKQLKDKLAAFLIARDPDVNTPGKRRTTTNQAKFKADNFVTLLWLKAPGDRPPYTPGDVDGLFAFFDRRRAHSDMGKKRTFFNHDHRVCAWLWPSMVHDYASFKADSNKYVARQARGFLTGVRAVHGLYEIYKGEARWPDVVRTPVDEDATPGKRCREAKARVRSGRKRVRKAKRSEEEDEEASTDSSGDESEADDGAWSCDDGESSSSDDGDDDDAATRKPADATAQAFAAMGRYTL